MDYLSVLKSVPDIYASLKDETSRKIFNARLSYLFNRHQDSLWESLVELSDDWEIPALDRLVAHNGNVEEIIIYGTGAVGLYTLKLLLHSKYSAHPIIFCNSQNQGDRKICVYGKEYPCIEAKALLKRKETGIVIVGSSLWQEEITNHLIDMRFPIWRILYPEKALGGMLYGRLPGQYFDVLLPQEKEVFLDAGALDGMTSVEFVQWCHGDYEKIYAIEPNPDMIPACRETFEKYGIKRTELIQTGVWSCKSALHFEMKGGKDGGAHIDNRGDLTIPVNKIDEILQGERVSYIKMDIEGSEYQALLGAQTTIKELRPRMALSLYHKPEDIIEIPYLVKTIHPDYQLALRQYASNGWETVLYVY